MNEAIKRFYEAAGCRTQKELAEFLEIRQPSVANAHKRRAIPAEWLLTLLGKKGTNPGWVLTGRGSRSLAPFGAALADGDAFCFSSKAHALSAFSDGDLVDELGRRAKAVSARLTVSRAG